MGDRRFELRFPVSELVKVSWIDTRGAAHECAGTLRDLSPSGASIQLERPLRLLSFVDITARNKKLKARVRSCGRSRIGHNVGVEFDSESQGILKALS
jgi:hypothetical protein